MVDGRGWLDGELRKIGAGLDRMKLGTRHALREGACLVFFWCWGGWLRGQIGKVAARADWEGGCAGRLGGWLRGRRENVSVLFSCSGFGMQETLRILRIRSRSRTERQLIRLRLKAALGLRTISTNFCIFINFMLY